MITYRDRTFCSARCATVECPRRWATATHEAAQKWWGQFSDERGAPVSFANYAPGCPIYRQPDPHNQDHRSLRPGETNPDQEPADDVEP